MQYHINIGDFNLNSFMAEKKKIGFQKSVTSCSATLDRTRLNPYILLKSVKKEEARRKFSK